MPAPQPAAPNLAQLDKKLNAMRIAHGMLAGTMKLTPMEDGPILGVNMKGMIDQRRWNAEISVNLSWQPGQDPRIADYCSKLGIADPFETAVLDVGRHELTHWSKCPHGLMNAGLCVDAVKKALEAKGKKSDDMACYMANVFYDLIVNAQVVYDKQGSGFPVVYSACIEEGGHYSEFFEAYMRLSMMLWGTKEAEELVSRYYVSPHDPAAAARISAAVAGAAKDLGLDKGTLEEKLERLRDSKNWPALAAKLAQHLAPLMQMKKGGSGKAGGKGMPSISSEGEEGEDGDGSGQGEKDKDKKKGSGSGEGEEEKKEKEKQEGNGGGGKEEEEKKEKEDEAGGGKKGKEKKEKPIPSDGSGQDDEVDEFPTSPGDMPFKKELNSKEGQKKLMEEMLKSGQAKAPGGSWAGRPSGTPGFMPLDAALDVYYEFISPPIPVKAEGSGTGLDLPIVRENKREYDPVRHKDSDISGILVTPEGDAALAVRRRLFTVRMPFKDELHAFPNICIIIDSSGSMTGMDFDQKHEGRWKNDEGYHYALMGLYGLRNWLRSESIMPYIQSNLISFSNTTRSTGWIPYESSHDISDLALKPEGGGTGIDMDVIRRELGSQKPCVVLLLSDGGIFNWSQIETEFMAELGRHFVSFIQIGGETNVSKAFKKAGYPVHKVSSVSDLQSLMIDLTAQSYKEIL